MGKKSKKKREEMNNTHSAKIAPVNYFESLDVAFSDTAKNVDEFLHMVENMISSSPSEPIREMCKGIHAKTKLLQEKVNQQHALINTLKLTYEKHADRNGTDICIESLTKPRTDTIEYVGEMAQESEELPLCTCNIDDNNACTCKKTSVWVNVS